MRKRSLKLLVLLAVICAAASSFVSCKDSYSDDYAPIQHDVDVLNQTLKEVVDKQEAILDGVSDSLKETRTNIQTQINNTKTELTNTIGGMKTEIYTVIDTVKLKAYYLKVDSLYERVATLETEYQELNTSITMINDTLAKYRGEINDLLGKYLALNTTMNDVLGRLKIVEDDVDNLKDKVKKDSIRIDLLYDSIDSLWNLVPTINSRLNVLGDSIYKINGIAQLALDYAVQHESAISDLQKKFADFYTKQEVEAMMTDIKADIDAKLADAKAATEKAQQTADDAKKLAESADSLANVAKNLANDAMAQANENKTKISDLEKAYKDADDKLAGDISALDTRLTTVEGKVADLAKDLGILQGTVDKIKNDIAKMIVGVTYQGIVNPVIGQFSLPVGLENNMLFAWFGENTTGNQPKWPNNHLEASDLDMMGGHETFGIEAGDIFVTNMDEGKAYLGRVYTTINPNTVNFAGQNLKIVDSQDKESGAYLEPLKNSDELLQFGFTRGANNGFYEADAWIDYDKVESIRLTKKLDKTQIKEALKTTLSGLKANLKGNNAGLGITTLYKTFMDNVKCIIPQYGLKASWLDSDSKEHSVYSKYGLAVTSIKPASFDFLKDYKTPKIPLISEIKFDVEFKLDSVHYDPITAPDMKLTLYIVFKDIVIEEKDINQKTVVGVFSNKSDADACVASNPGAYIESKVFTVPEFQEFVDDINNGLIRKVNRDVNKLIEQITGQTQKNVNKALGQVNNDVIGRVNKVITKINNRLADLNHYLQPTALYSSDRLKNGAWVTEWYPLSNNWLVPSPVNCSAEGGYVQIEPTTITAESVCPCYRKFVAVTNVFKADYSTSAKAGNVACKAALDEANKPAPDLFNSLGVHSMKTVYSDNQDLVFAVMPGYVYEITYAALDYSGKTRVHKYYVKARNY